MDLVSEKICCILGLPLKSIPRTVRECHCYSTEYEIIINKGQCVYTRSYFFTDIFCVGVRNYFVDYSCLDDPYCLERCKSFGLWRQLLLVANQLMACGQFSFFD